ncbi:MAG: MMPL family transporter [Planctomycetales bacterium]|nr:MMPL family transporter [Planctomycetales bacterium]
MLPPQAKTTDPSFLARPLAGLARLACKAPRIWLSVFLALAGGSLFLGATSIELRTSRLDLLNPKSGYNQLWIDFVRDFGEDDDAVVVVSADNKDDVVEAVDAIAVELTLREKYFRDVLWKIDTSRLQSKGLYYLAQDELQQIEGFLSQSQPVLEGDWSRLQLGSLLLGLTQAAKSPDPPTRTAALQAMRRHANNLSAALSNRPEYESPWALPGNAHVAPVDDTSYLLADDDRLGIVLLHLNLADDGFDRGGRAIDQLRQILSDLQRKHSRVEIGLTGLPVMENDEMRASQRATLRASGISLVGVSLLFIAGFGGMRRPLLAVATLVIGLAWSVGYLTLAVGHLNILSMSFGIILIGLGIDFGIHYLARYQSLRAENATCEKALVAASEQVGPGIVTGGLTTAFAFFAAGLTKFTGVAELGIIAGGGVLLCVLAALAVLPVLLLLSDRRFTGPIVQRVLPVDRWFGLPYWMPRSTFVAGVAATLLLAVALPSLIYDHNLLNLQPVGLESVDLEEMLLERTDQSVWYALSLAESPAQLLQRKQEFESLPSVERTEEIVSMLPSTTSGKSTMIQKIRDRLAGFDKTPPVIPINQPQEMLQILAGVSQSLAADDPTHAAVARIDEVSRKIGNGKEESSAYFAALQAYQKRLAVDLADQLVRLRNSASIEPPTTSDLPASLVSRFIGESGRHLIKVYSKADIWDMDELEKFVQQVRQVDPRATGKPLQTYEASRQMIESYLHAALYALIGVMMLLVFDFQSLRFALLALVPVGLGMLQMFGLMGWLAIPLNPANMIVLPLILGIGLDDGVHVLHDFRAHRGPYRMSRSTATAILLTSLTTMVGFGSMMIADHRGLQSLGRVLTIGVFCCLISSLVVLPALLRWATCKRAENDEAPRPSEEFGIPTDSPVFRLHDSAEVAPASRKA